MEPKEVAKHVTFSVGLCGLHRSFRLMMLFKAVSVPVKRHVVLETEIRAALMLYEVCGTRSINF